MWQVEVREEVCDKLYKIPNPDKRRIENVIYGLEDGPDLFDIRKLVGHDGYRLRIGKWRLLLDIDWSKQEISIYGLFSRGKAYKKKNQ